MFGFRLLAIILGFICLAAAGTLVLHSCPEMAEVDAFVIDNLIPEGPVRSEEHTSELQSHSFISYAVFCLKKKK